MIITPPNAFPTSIAVSGSWVSGYVPFQDLNAVSVSVKSTQAGELTVQRYLDNAGTIPIDAPASAAISAGTIATVSINDGLAATSFQVEITNTGGATATISDTAIILQHL